MNLRNIPFEYQRSFIHIIYVPFTGVGLYKGYRGDKWYKDRIEIFKDYTLESLYNQSKKNFLLWVSFRKEEENNPDTKELSEHIESLGIKHVFTFDGLMYWDDKFTDDYYSKLLNYGRIIRECWRNKTWEDLPNMLKEVLYNKNLALEKRLENSLKQVKKCFNTSKRIDYVYVTRLDSDDMLRSKVVEEISNHPPFEGALVMGRGYIYNKDTKQLAEYNPKTNPPFHTIIFPYEAFVDAKEHLNYFSDFRSHEDIPRIFITTNLGDFRYCVLTHNPKMHISTIWNHPFKGKEIGKNEKDSILKDFGIINY